MAKEKRSHHKQPIDKSIRQPSRTMQRPPAIFTEIHDKIIFGRLKPYGNQGTMPYRSSR